MGFELRCPHCHTWTARQRWADIDVTTITCPDCNTNADVADPTARLTVEPADTVRLEPGR